MSTSSPPRRVVFVAGLGHSGSTLLHLLLGAHPRVLALGEAETTMRATARADRICTCGTTAATCPLWGPVLDRVAGSTDRTADGIEPIVARYEQLLAQVDELHAREVVVVDESKNLWAVEALLRTGVEVDALLLVRDVRSWTNSSRRRADRLGRLDVRTALARRDLRTVARRPKFTGWSRFTLWEKSNLEFERRLRELGILRAVVGYETLATAPEPTMRSICTALGLDFEPAMLRPADGIGHVLEGNHRTLDPDRAATVSYSTAWLAQRDWVLPAKLRPRIMATNARLVYGSDRTA